MIESAISAACEEMASEIAENLRLQKLKDAENEISQENLVRPSELLAQQRRNRKSPPKETVKPTQNLPEEKPLQDTHEQTTQSSTEKLEKSNAEKESKSVPIKSPSPPPTQEAVTNIPTSQPKQESNENLSQPEIEIPKQIPKSELETSSSVSDEVSPVKEDNRAENNSPPEVINEQSPAVIKSTKSESGVNSKNSSQSMTSSIQGMSLIVFLNI